MATTIQIKRSSVTGNQPNTAQLAVGELGINLIDHKLFSSNGTVVFEIGSNLSALSVTGETTTNLTIQSALTDARAAALTLTHSTSGSAAVGLGVSQEYVLETESNTHILAGTTWIEATNVSAGQESFSYNIGITSSGNTVTDPSIRVYSNNMIEFPRLYVGSVNDSNRFYFMEGDANSKGADVEFGYRNAAILLESNVIGFLTGGNYLTATVGRYSGLSAAHFRLNSGDSALSNITSSGDTPFYADAQYQIDFRDGENNEYKLYAYGDFKNSSDYERIGLTHSPSTNIATLAVEASGNGVVRPLTVDMNGTEGLRINPDGSMVQKGLTYPTSDGTNGQAITTNGAGVLSFTTIGSSDIINLEEPRVAIEANDINIDEGAYFTKTITDAVTFTVSGTVEANNGGGFILQLTNGGSNTVTWPGSVSWAGGSEPNLTAAGTDIITFVTFDEGTTWDAWMIDSAGGITAGDDIVSNNTGVHVDTKNLQEEVVAVGGGTSPSINVDSGAYFTKTVATGTTTFTFNEAIATDHSRSFILELTNGGSQTVNWPAAVDWAGGAAPTLTTSGVDILSFTTFDQGTTWYGAVFSAAAA